MTMIDIGDQRMARSFFRTARTAADETGDRALRAWVAVREALVPLYYGDPREASSQARAAGDLAGRTPCVAGVMAPVIEARAFARMAGAGKREALDRTKAVLERARAAFGQLPAADRSDTAFGYTERQLCFHEGDVLVTMGDHRSAEEVLSRSLRLYPVTEFLDRSLVQLGQARCRLASGEPDEAMRLSHDAISCLPREHRAEILVRTARSIVESVQARGVGAAAAREHAGALWLTPRAC
jgi:tetratricopeptide (TPR) repeat protein